MSGERTGIPFVVAAPSGTGKTTVCRAVLEADPQVVFSVSHTTRPRRTGEVDGRDYHFVSHAEFQQLVEEGAFLEWAYYNDQQYGTTHAAVDDALTRGHDVFLEIEVEGARQVRERRADARFVFLLPPSLKVLRERLKGRGTEGEEAIGRRLALARRELEAAALFDYGITNDDLSRCVADVLRVLRAERSGQVADLRLELDAEAAVARLRDAHESA